MYTGAKGAASRHAHACNKDVHAHLFVYFFVDVDVCPASIVEVHPQMCKFRFVFVCSHLCVAKNGFGSMIYM